MGTLGDLIGMFHQFSSILSKQHFKHLVSAGRRKALALTLSLTVIGALSECRPKPPRTARPAPHASDPPARELQSRPV